MEHTGWVKIDRGILDWEYWDDISTRNVFLTCILRANYEATKWKGIDVEVGSMLTTLDGLAKMTGLTTQQTRTALKKLTSTVDCNGDPRTPELTIKTTNKYTIVTITKYALYQGIDGDIYNASNTNCNNQLTNKKEISPTPPIKNIKEGEEIKEKNISKDIFEKKETKFDFKASLIQLGVLPQVADDWIMVRKNKRLSFTETIFEAVRKNLIAICTEFSISANDAIRICAEKSWGGCEIRFFRNSGIAKNDLFNSETPAPSGAMFDVFGNEITDNLQ